MLYSQERQNYLEERFKTTIFSVGIFARDGLSYSYSNSYSNLDNIIKQNINFDLLKDTIEYSLHINHTDTKNEFTVFCISKIINYTADFFIPNSFDELIIFLNNSEGKKIFYKNFK